MSQELVDGFNMVPPQVSCHTQEVVQGLQPGETAQGLHQLEQDGTAQGPSHDGRPSDYTTVKKSRWGPPMTASNVLSTTTMASNDLSTTNTALDVSSVTAVSSEPVLAGTDLAGTDLAGSVADLAGPDSGQVQVPIWQVPIWQVPIWQVPPGPSIVKPKKGAKGHIPYLFLFFSITAAINCSSLWRRFARSTTVYSNAHYKDRHASVTL